MIVEDALQLQAILLQHPLYRLLQFARPLLRLVGGPVGLVIMLAIGANRNQLLIASCVACIF